MAPRRLETLVKPPFRNYNPFFTFAAIQLTWTIATAAYLHMKAEALKYLLHANRIVYACMPPTSTPDLNPLEVFQIYFANNVWKTDTGLLIGALIAAGLATTLLLANNSQ